MQVHLRTRVNKIAKRARVSGDFVIYDNCNEVRYDKPRPINRAELERLRATKPANARDHIVTMLKDPRCCAADEEYSVVEVWWRDRVTGETYHLLFDTIAFLTNDNGDTQKQLPAKEHGAAESAKREVKAKPAKSVVERHGLAPSTTPLALTAD